MKTIVTAINSRIGSRAAPLAAIGLFFAGTPALHATELLVNGSFSDNSGWTVVPPESVNWTCIANGEANLHPYPSGYIGTVITQPVTVANPGGRMIHFSAVMTKVAAPSGNTVEFILEYLDATNTARHLTILAPANDPIASETPLSADVVLPLDAKSITGFSVNKTFNGMFTLQSVSLDLLAPLVTITSPANGAAFTAGSDVEVLVTVDPILTGSRKMDILDNGVVVGSAVPTSLFGEWSFPDTSHLSVMVGAAPGEVMIDYSPPFPASMFWFNGTFTTPTTFTDASQNVTVQFGFSNTGLLNATITGPNPLGTRNLVGGQSLNETFRFLWSHPAAGPHSITALVTHNDGTTTTSLISAPVNITVSAPTAPEMDVLGNSLSIPDGDITPVLTDHTDFGSVPASSGTVVRTFTIRNTGTAVLNLTGTPRVVAAGTNAADFVVTVQPPVASMAAGGGSTTFQVRFDPGAIGTRTANLSIANNDANENPYNFMIKGTGTGPEMDVLGNSLSIPDGDITPALGDLTDFGSVPASSGTVVRTFTIKNTGTAALNLTGTPRVVVAGTNAADFVVTLQPLTASVAAAGGSTTFQVRFDPSAIGTRTANLSIANDDANENPYNFMIKGTGTGPEMDVLGNSLSIPDGDITPALGDLTDFGAVLASSGTVVRTFTIKNTGTAALSLTGTPRVVVAGTNASDFVVTMQPPTASVAAAGGSTTFQVRFDPGAVGTRTANLSIANNDANENPYNFMIKGTGTGPEMDVLGNSLSIPDGDITPALGDLTDFGSVLASSGTVVRIFTIKNRGTAALSLTGTPRVVVAGTNASDFVVTMQPPTASVAAVGGSTTFQVRFDPSVIGTRTANLSIANNDANENPYNFMIKGTGTAATTAVATGKDAAEALDGGALQTTTGEVWVDGERYLSLTVGKPAGVMDFKGIIEVSGNLTDWFSGPNHTTVLRDDASILKVRDNTPLTPDSKRHIRLKPPIR